MILRNGLLSYKNCTRAAEQRSQEVFKDISVGHGKAVTTQGEGLPTTFQ